MKKLPYIILIFALAILTTCKKKPELKVYKLELGEAVVEVTSSSATLSVDYSYPTEIESVKLLVSTESGLGDATETVVVVAENKLTATVDGLQPSTKYYYCFRYSTGVNLDNTETSSFTTLENSGGELSVTTLTVVSITTTTAVSGGNVTGDGGHEVTMRGVCWNTGGEPSLADDHTVDGSGLGVYLSSLAGLESSTEYHVRAYAINEMDTVYGETLDFTTQSNIYGTVVTSGVSDITMTSAKASGNVTDDGGVAVFERGICWDTLANPTVVKNKIPSGSGVGAFTCDMTGLTLYTTYHVRAYATNTYGTNYGDDIEFTTLGTVPVVTTGEVYDITSGSAKVRGCVNNDWGSNITERGICYSTSENPTIDNNKVTAGAGIGDFECQITNMSFLTTYYVRAYATNEYGTNYGDELSFTTLDALHIYTYDVDIEATKVTFHGEVTIDEGSVGNIGDHGFCFAIHSNPTYDDNQITVVGPNVGMFSQSINRKLILCNLTCYVRSWVEVNNEIVYGNEVAFIIEAPQTATGAISGVFSVSNIKQVWFSKGNLQYQASTDTWRFAENQYDNIGTGNSNISGSYSGWIDLYGWGTGDDPTTTVGYEYFTTDWGVNAISNGGSTPNMWCTLSEALWEYILFTRETPSGIRFAKARINDINGLILLPDDWNSDYYDLSNPNMGGLAYSNNVISLWDWNSVFESHGAVFLPITGIRKGTVVSEDTIAGYYWSSSYYSIALVFKTGSLVIGGDCVAEWATAVRLVKYVQ
jgi:hypothetical protein